MGVPRPTYPRTIPEFNRFFPDEQACLDFLAACRWPDGCRCPRCGHDEAFVLPRRRLWQCNWQDDVPGPDPFGASWISRNAVEAPEGSLRSLARISGQNTGGFEAIHLASAPSRATRACQVAQSRPSLSTKRVKYASKSAPQPWFSTKRTAAPAG